MRALIAIILSLFTLSGGAIERPASWRIYEKVCTAGTHYWAYTTDGTTIRSYGRSCLPGACMSKADIAARVWESMLAASPMDAASAAMGTPAFACDDAVLREQTTDRGVLCRERVQLVQSHFRDVGGQGYDDVQEPNCAPPPPPPPVAWRVKPNTQAADLSRPIYTLSADAAVMVITTRPALRAAAGVPCDPGKVPTKTSGADLYATPDGFAAGSVALCAKQ